MREQNARSFWLGDEAPRWWHRARGVYDAGAGLAGGVNFRLALALAAALGRAAHRATRRSPSLADVRRIFPDRSTRDLRRIAREISALRYQNRVLVARAAKGGIPELSGLFVASDLAALETLRAQGPAILLTWHVGPAFALSHALSGLRFPLLALRRTENVPALPGLELMSTDGDSDARAAALAGAVARVRNGGFVMMAPDTLGDARTMGVPCLGRAVPLACGPFVLARITGAPVVPIAARWDDQGAIRLEQGAPFPAQGHDHDVEGSLATAAGAWLEKYLQKAPGQLWLRSVRWLLDAPLLTP